MRVGSSVHDFFYFFGLFQCFLPLFYMATLFWLRSSYFFPKACFLCVFHRGWLAVVVVPPVPPYSMPSQAPDATVYLDVYSCICMCVCVCVCVWGFCPQLLIPLLRSTSLFTTRGESPK